MLSIFSIRCLLVVIMCDALLLLLLSSSFSRVLPDCRRSHSYTCFYLLSSICDLVDVETMYLKFECICQVRASDESQTSRIDCLLEFLWLQCLRFFLNFPSFPNRIICRSTLHMSRWLMAKRHGNKLTKLIFPSNSNRHQFSSSFLVLWISFIRAQVGEDWFSPIISWT